MLKWLKKKPETLDAPVTFEATLPGSDQDRVIDVMSPTWRSVRKTVTEELNKARLQNDKLTNDADKTAAIRGRIKLLKEILEWPSKQAEKPQRTKGLLE